MAMVQSQVCISSVCARGTLSSRPNQRARRSPSGHGKTASFKRSSIVAMAEPRENVDEFATQGAIPGEEVPGFDYGHEDGHHMWKSADGCASPSLYHLPEFMTLCAFK
ncbi:hypothetical protein CYMTET_21830 [Cymbomonas tetramitiformis]|uniref:Uncharacterized protein n=1 Tax=Cymbomonas tetramitiformis TaxID=36881 RepID=A0AAE0G190_9CHLO|nr:hypothetical protein CYMTET_21830 [Cymbomonas tetramitiformis]